MPYTANFSHKEDIEKWRNLIQERNDLKGTQHTMHLYQSKKEISNCEFYLSVSDALQRTNATMRQQYTMVNDWHNCVKDLKENHDKELKKFRTINDEV